MTTCVCGHAAKHHSRRDSVYAGLMADYRVVWRCAWRGCGCPEFVKTVTPKNADSAGVRRDE